MVLRFKALVLISIQENISVHDLRTSLEISQVSQEVIILHHASYRTPKQAMISGVSRSNENLQNPEHCLTDNALPFYCS